MAAGTTKRVQVLTGILGVLGVAYYFTIGREQERKTVNQYVATSMADIENKVATDAVAQYEIAKRQGDPMQMCAQAGFVSAAWLQAKDEVRYGAAKATEKLDCEKAGVRKP